MSSDSEDSSFDVERQDSRLTNIWKSIQQTKNLGNIHEKGYSGYHRSRHRSRKEQSSPEGQPNYKQNLAHLLKKVHQLESENQSLQSQIQMLRAAHDEERNNLKREFESKLKNHLRKMKTNQKQNLNTQSDISKVQSLSREIDRLNLKIKSLQMEKRNQDIENNRLTELNQIYSSKIQNQNKQNAFQGRGEQLLQLEEALQTITRLAELLRKTEEYKSLGALLEEPKNMHYLKNVLKRFKNNQLLTKPIDKKICSCSQAKMVPQKVLWSPTQCYKTLLELKMKYDYLSEDCIEEVLLQMNKIYLSKEQKALQKQKQFYENQISKLKKQTELGYDDLLTKKQINRLKNQLRAAKSAQKVKAPAKIQVLKDKGQLSDLLKLKEREIKLLRQRVRLFETENGFNDKVLYYEGTLWALDRVLNQLQNNEGGLKQFEMKFRERLDQNVEVQDWLRSYKQFFQALEQLNGGLIQRVLTLKETTLRKIGRFQ